MSNLVTLQQAKQQAGITINDDDELIQFNLDVAEAFVLKHISRSTDVDWTAEIAAWTDATVPKEILAAILRIFLNLQSDRGDDPNRRRESVINIPIEVEFLLRPYRDHVLA